MPHSNLAVYVPSEKQYIAVVVLMTFKSVIIENNPPISCKALKCFVDPIEFG